MDALPSSAPAPQKTEPWGPPAVANQTDPWGGSTAAATASDPWQSFGKNTLPGRLLSKVLLLNVSFSAFLDVQSRAG